MTASATTTFACPRCGFALTDGQLACPNCGSLVYARQLNEIAAAAQQEEMIDPTRAVAIWQQALPMLPADSQQRQIVLDRMAALRAGGIPPTAAGTRPVPRNDPLNVAIAKTVGSMLISILVYTFMFSSGPGGLMFGLKFATGFVLLILVHELGHSVAMRHYRLSASPPIFIPFIGAVINLRQPPRNALEEAVVGIAGPVLGTVGAIVTYLIYLQTGSLLFLLLAEFGFFLNLLNMLPVPPLDGGRVTAAVSPWIWMPGLLGVVAWIAYDFFVNNHFNFIFILLLIMAWPRIKMTVLGGGQRGPYYQIGGAAKWTMGAAYALLLITLATMWFVCKIETLRFMGPGWI